MADQGQKTEQPSQRKIQKARDAGQSAASIELLIGVQLAAGFYLGRHWLAENFTPAVQLLRRMVELGFETTPDVTQLRELYRLALLKILVPAAMAGVGVTVSTVVAQLLLLGAPVSLKRLSPHFERLVPGQRLASLPKQNLIRFGKALVVLGIGLLITYFYLRTEFPKLIRISGRSLQAAILVVGDTFQGLLTRLVSLAVSVGLIDFAYQKWQFRSNLKMTKQEVVDEQRESEGRPEVKMRLRRLRRDLRRRRMMRDVPKATFVVVNPTHYAVAVRYQIQSMAAPVVVAKGRNYVAQRIRALANTHQIPIVENPPLAQALYKSAEVGQEIPPQLYQAVAEILAYIYRLLNGRLPG